MKGFTSFADMNESFEVLLKSSCDSSTHSLKMLRLLRQMNIHVINVTVETDFDDKSGWRVFPAPHTQYAIN